VSRLEEREPDLDAVVVDAMAKNVHRAALIELLRKPIGELLAGAVHAAVNCNESPQAFGCVSAMKPKSSAVSSPRTRSKSAAHSGLSPLADPVSALLDEAGGDRVLEAPLVRFHPPEPSYGAVSS